MDTDKLKELFDFLDEMVQKLKALKTPALDKTDAMIEQTKANNKELSEILAKYEDPTDIRFNHQII